MEKQKTKWCGMCGLPFVPTKENQETCSDNCQYMLEKSNAYQDDESLEEFLESNYKMYLQARELGIC